VFCPYVLKEDVMHTCALNGQFPLFVMFCNGWRSQWMEATTTCSRCCLLYQASLREVGCVVFKHPIFPSLASRMLNPKSL
jgi:hypothetical protein